MADYDIRALEIHSYYAWDFDWIEKCMDFMEQEGLNALVLHRNDFIDLIIYPGKYFGCSEDKKYRNIFERYADCFRSLYKYTPTRRSSPYQRRAFLKRVIERAKCKGFKIFIENKELYFPDIILEFFPNLVKEGKICANDPFWLEFLNTKYTEFFEEFPEVDGIITSLATGESRVSIKSNRCTCQLCQSTSKEEWFRKVLKAMYEPIHKANKMLIVRDFVFDPISQHEIAKVMEEQPSDVGICLKNTPHDYYPTFPENSRIGNVGNHPQFIEFDAMGQYFGWGICIADIMEDYRWRLKSAKNKGACGFIVRTDWESLDGHTVFRTPNLINLYSIAELGINLNTPAQTIYDKFLSREGWYRNNITSDERNTALEYYSSIMSKTWDITKRTVFVDGCVFSDSSLMPISYDHAFWLSEEKNSLKDWDKTKQDVLSPLKVKLEYAIEEKNKALSLAVELEKEARKGCCYLEENKVNDLIDRLRIQIEYVTLFKMATEAILLARYIMETEEEHSGKFWDSVIDTFRNRMDDLQKEEKHLSEFWQRTNYHPHTIYTLLDPERIECLWNKLYEKTKEVLCH